jgi:hypothetical protein
MRSDVVLLEVFDEILIDHPEKVEVHCYRLIDAWESLGVKVFNRIQNAIKRVVSISLNNIANSLLQQLTKVLGLKLSLFIYIFKVLAEKDDNKVRNDVVDPLDVSRSRMPKNSYSDKKL